VQIDQEAISKLDSFSSKGACFDIQERCPQSTLFQHAGLENLDRGSSQKIHPGDVLSIVIFEAQGGLYHPINPEGAGGTPVTELPNQRIDQDGMINIPFAGSLKALGKTTKELEEEIKRILTGKTTDPQVVVNISGRGGGDLITIAGDVERPTGVPVTLAGTRIVDAIAASGGSKTRPHAVLVSVTRGSASRFDTLQAIYDNPSKNIYLNPGDTVLLRNIPLTCMVFGASGMIATLPILYDDLNLAQIMGSTGGASDARANPAEIFIYRKEPRDFLEALGRKNLPEVGDKIPVIYQLSLNKPRGFFYAKDFKIRDGDILYYSNAGLVGLSKFASLVNTLISPVTNSVYNASRSATLVAPSALPLMP
jgi:polysaccharide export outer membrane protein